MNVIWKMKVTTTENGTFDLQIEDWSKDYPGVYPYGNTMVAYPESKCSLDGSFAPRRGERFRCAFNFPNHALALDTAETIALGEGELSWFIQYLEKQDYQSCLTGNVSS